MSVRSCVARAVSKTAENASGFSKRQTPCLTEVIPCLHMFLPLMLQHPHVKIRNGFVGSRRSTHARNSFSASLLLPRKPKHNPQILSRCQELGVD